MGAVDPMTPIEYIWSEQYMVILERKLWIKVMEYQHLFGGDHLVAQAQLDASKQVMTQVDLESIRRREMVTKHDVKARLDEFVELSGHSRIHLGMTSADVVENSYLIRQRESVQQILFDQGDSQSEHLSELRAWMRSQQFRGIRGPIGSDTDQMDLFDQNTNVVLGLSSYVAEQFGFRNVINSVGQCMPRSLDLALGRLLFDMLSDPVDRAVGNGILTMLGAQEFWLEGDVATSCVRRYAWPLLFSVVDGSYRKRLSRAETH